MQIVRFILMTLAILVITSTMYAQSNFWLQGTWRGKAYLPGSDGSQYYLLVMSILEIKGNKFEGIIATMQPTDTSYRFDSRISGVVYDKYLIINRTRILYVKDAPDIKWKVSCNNCKPPRMLFSIEKGKIFFRGEEKECYKECNGVSEFSKDIAELDSSKKEAVYALVNYVQPPQTDTASLAKNTDPISTNTVAGRSQQNISEQRIPVLPSGSIALGNIINVGSLQKETVSLHKSISLMIKENPPPRISILPPGDVVSTNHNNINTLSEKETVALHNNISLMIKENPPPRVSVLPSGDIVAIKNHAALSIDKKVTYQSQRNTPSLTVQQNNLVAVTKSSLADSLALTKAGDTSAQKIIAMHRDLIALPADYAERKKNVIRTLAVTTDSVVLRVYDNGVVDGDIVSVIYNDNVVIDKLSLTTRAVVVKIPVNPSQTNTLVFHAHNLGEFPPNTAKLEILYGNKKEELTVSSDLTVSSTIDIVHE